MTSRQRTFCRFLLKGSPVRRAAEQAGYAPLSIQHNLDTLLTSRSVSAFLARHAYAAQAQLERLRLSAQTCQRLMQDQKQTGEVQIRAVAHMMRLVSRFEHLQSLAAYTDELLDGIDIPEYTAPAHPQPTRNIPANQQAPPAPTLNEKALQASQSQTTKPAQAATETPAQSPPPHPKSPSKTRCA